MSLFFFTFLSWSHAMAQHTLTNVSFDPPSPSSVDWGEWVTVTFDYTTSYSPGVYMGIVLLSDTPGGIDYGSSGSQFYPAPSGQATQGFIINSGITTIDHIILQMFQEDFRTLLYEEQFDVSFRFPREENPNDVFEPFANCEFRRRIVHLTREGGGFTTHLILENFSSHQQTATLQPYDNDGNWFSSKTFQVPAGATMVLDPLEEFANGAISHFSIEPNSLVVVTASYQAEQEGSPAFVTESCEASRRWRLFQSNWDLVFDGIAIVNAGKDPTAVRVDQIGANGQILQSHEIASALPVNGKALLVFDAVFTPQDNASYEIVSGQPVTLMGLAGTRPGSVVNALWAPPAMALPDRLDE
jgi:hypothetical protein